MQCKLRFPAAAYDFNQFTQYFPRPSSSLPRRFWPLPRPSPHCGEGGVPRPAPPRPAPPREKNSFPVHPCWKASLSSLSFRTFKWVWKSDYHPHYYLIWASGVVEQTEIRIVWIRVYTDFASEMPFSPRKDSTPLQSNFSHTKVMLTFIKRIFSFMNKKIMH